MEIESPKLGVIPFALEEVLILPSGLLDYPERRRWLLLSDACHGELYWLQSLDDPQLALSVVGAECCGVDCYGGVPSDWWHELMSDGGDGPVALVRVEPGPQGLVVDVDRPILIHVQRRVGWHFSRSTGHVSQSAQPEQIVPLCKAA